MLHHGLVKVVWVYTGLVAAVAGLLRTLQAKEYRGLVEAEMGQRER